ncbi:hypothetical protein FACS1894120_0090 [Clostridia bacterium]|nr:hypothetical protein FACS1894120_0090 [Clostridia bacterium]
MKLKILSACLCVILFTSCGIVHGDKSIHVVTESRTIYSLGTVIHLNVEFPNVDDALRVLDEIAAATARIDRDCDIFGDGGDGGNGDDGGSGSGGSGGSGGDGGSGSEIATINRDGGGEVSEWLYGLLTRSFAYAEETKGAFDPTLGSLITLWGMDDINGARAEKSFKPPADIAKAVYGYEHLKFVHEQYVEMDDNNIKLNLGAIAKGHATDVAVSILGKSDCTAALLDFGGSAVFYGGDDKVRAKRKLDLTHPAKDGSVLIETTLSKLTKDGRYGEYDAVFSTTSGSYRRYYEYSGKKYHHILDPATGYPADSGVTSVTIIGGGSIADTLTDKAELPGEYEPPGEYMDALSTALFVMGADKGLDFINRRNAVKSTKYSVIFITDDKHVRTSDDIDTAQLRILDNAYTFA